MIRPLKTCALAFATTLLAAAVSGATAQGPGGPPGMGGSGFHGGPGQHPPPMGPGGDVHGGLELGPPGRWWDDRQLATTVGLRPEQRTRMDAIFEQNRGALQTRLDAVHQAEAQMHELAKSSAPDEATMFAQIDRIAQARAELEKATTHMMLLIRKEMDAGQIKALEQQMQH